MKSLIGQSSHFLQAIEKTSLLAKIDRPVLIIGERGTGKELIAERLHYLSNRWQQPFISLNCATLTDGLIDSELFGHEIGAFTDAKQKHLGRFERAQNGTLFLDEIATAPMQVQEKLLRVLEYGEYERIGGKQKLFTKARVIAATNADLPQLARLGKFRFDLLDRLAFDVIYLPPLRERKSDITVLAEHFAIKMAQEIGAPLFPGFSLDALDALKQYPWPGNVRELKNVVERAVYHNTQWQQPITRIVFDPFARHPSSEQPWLASTDNGSLKERVRHGHNDSFSSTMCTQAIDKSPHPFEQAMPFSKRSTLPIDLKARLNAEEKSWIEYALNQAKFNQTMAANLLNISYDSLRGLIKKHRLLIKCHQKK